MGVKVTTKVNKFPVMQKTIKAIDGTRICVGVTGEHAWLAGIHEYGCKIPVTDKMRAYLHHLGVHLKASTTEITIPERSFLRAGYDSAVDEVSSMALTMAAIAVFEGYGEAWLYTRAGDLLMNKIKDYAIDLKEPEKSDLTLRLHPGKENPLIQTGDMVGAITYEVKK